jgi:hypothetical protein
LVFPFPLGPNIQFIPPINSTTSLVKLRIKVPLDSVASLVADLSFVAKTDGSTASKVLNKSTIVCFADFNLKNSL